MIRLVTQFDSVETHPSLATPTCGGCCCSCCCCCLATVIGASSLSAQHVSSLQRHAPPAEQRAGAPVLAFFALPIALGLGAATAGAGFVAAPLVWALILWIAYRRVRAAHTILPALGTAFVGSVVFVAEFFVALALLEALGAYIIASIVVGLAVAAFGYLAMR